MSMEHQIYVLREWMYNNRDTWSGEVTKEYCDGLRIFWYQETSQPLAHEHGKILSSCCMCVNENR